jgi:cytochrome P450 PksS
MRAAQNRDSTTYSTVKIVTREFKADPFPFYAHLRSKQPVCCVTLPDGQSAWLIACYDDVLATLKDSRFAKDRSNAMTAEQLGKQPWIPGFAKPLTRNMLDLDEPDHTRLRTLVQKAFTPTMVERLRERIQTICDQLLDPLEEKHSVDLVQAYALQVPLTVIVELLGIPGRDRERFHRWSKAIVKTPTRVNMIRALPSLMAFTRYLRQLFRELRNKPQDGLLSALVQVEEAGDRMTEDELLAMAFLLLVAGHETTVNLIASGTLALLQHPDQLERLRENPSLTRTATEELLRYTNPLETATERYAREDVTIAGVTIPRGSLVLAAVASANRDATQFEDPERLDITRANNRHLAFGHGPHFCLGAPLARLEGQIAIPALIRRLPKLRLAVPAERLRWRATPILRGLEALPVVF